jgi:hypothetical protein
MVDNVFTEACKHCKEDRKRIDEANSVLFQLSDWAKETGDYPKLPHRTCHPCGTTGIKLTGAAQCIVDAVLVELKKISERGVENVA